MFLFLLAVCIIAVLVQRCHARGLIGSSPAVAARGRPRARARTVRVRVPSPMLPLTVSFDADDLVGFRISSSDEMCGICLESMEDSEVSSGACSHMFHTSCVANWLAKDPKRSCPMCREPFLGPDDPALIAPAPAAEAAAAASVTIPMAVPVQGHSHAHAHTHAHAHGHGHGVPELYARHSIRAGHRTYPGYAFVAHAPQTPPRLAPSSSVAGLRLLAIAPRRRHQRGGVFAF